MGWQAIAAVAASAMMKKMAQERAAMGQEFQEGFEEAETGGMDIGEQVRPGIGQTEGFFASFLKSLGQQYIGQKYAEWRGGPPQPNSPAVEASIMGQNKFEGGLRGGIPDDKTFEGMLKNKLPPLGSQSLEMQGMLMNKALQQIGVGQWFKNIFKQGGR